MRLHRKKREDVVCPLSCGECCSLWDMVGELAHIKESERQQGILRTLCPYLEPTGCLLPRKRRPDSCVGHLCRPVTEFIAGNWSREQALSGAKQIHRT